MSNKQKLLELEEKIHELQEYLSSDLCQKCFEANQRLEQHILDMESIKKLLSN